MMFALKITLEEFVAYVRLYALKTSRNMQKGKQTSSLTFISNSSSSGKDATLEMVAQSTNTNTTATIIKDDPSSEDDWSTELGLTADFLK